MLQLFVGILERERRCLAFLAALAFGLTQVSLSHAAAADEPQPASCRMAPDDEKWLRQALKSWAIASAELLRAGVQPLPAMVSHDAKCTYNIPAQSGSRLHWTAAANGGQVELPTGQKLPSSTPNSFTTFTSETGIFVVMSLPSVWRPVAPKSEIPMEWFLEVVLLHELTHAYRFKANPALTADITLLTAAEEETLRKLSENQAYTRDYETERDLFFGAAAAPGDGEARGLACDALDHVRQRRLRYFGASATRLIAAEDNALISEGTSQWMMYRWFRAQRHLSPALVLPKLRNSSRPHDEGMAIFLALDRLRPDWVRSVFETPSITVERLFDPVCDR